MPRSVVWPKEVSSIRTYSTIRLLRNVKHLSLAIKLSPHGTSTCVFYLANECKSYSYSEQSVKQA